MLQWTFVSEGRGEQEEMEEEGQDEREDVGSNGERYTSIPFEAHCVR